MVFPDRTLLEMVAARPSSLAELGELASEELLDELGVGYEALADTPLNTIEVTTPLELTTGHELAERIGLVNFLEGIGIDVDPNMVSSPRQSSYVRMDGWDEEAEKWFERKREEKQAASA